MKQLLTVLLILTSLAGFSQTYITPVATITQMKALNTGNKFVFVSDSNALYSVCSPCTVNDIDVFLGQSGKKWKKVVDGSRQALLVSGTNIKTINSQSLLGAGNINILGSAGGDTQVMFTALGDAITINPTFRFADDNWKWFRDDLNQTGNQYSLITKGGGAGTRRFLWTNSDNTIKFGSYIGDLSASSGVESAFFITPVISQSGTAGYNGLLVNVSTTGTGSGTKKLMDVQLNGTPVFTVNPSGSLKIVDGNQGLGKVMTSDANGVGTWQTPTGGGGGDVFLASNNVFTQPQTINIVGGKFLHIPTVEGRGEFGFTLDQSYVNGNGHVDNVMQWGWNHNGGGGRTNPLDAEFHMAIESEYQTFPGADPTFEFHIEGQALNNLTNRYMTFNASKTNGHGNGTFRMDSWQFYPNNDIGFANDTPYFVIGNGGQTTITGNNAKLDIVNGANRITMASIGPDMSWTNYGGGQAGFYSGSFVITAQTNSAAGYIYLRPGGGDTYIEKNANDRNKLILTNSSTGSSAYVSEEFQTNAGVTGKIIANNSNTSFTDLLAGNTFSLIGFQSAGVNIYSANASSKIRLAVGANQTLTDVVAEISKDSVILKKPLRFPDGTTQSTAGGGGSTFTTEDAQDAVGAMASSEFTYVDGSNLFSINTIAQSKITGLVAALGLKADLVSGIVPTSQLPSSVVGIVQVANFASLPGTGASNTIYITTDNNKRYIYTTSYIELGATPPVTSVNSLTGDVVLTAASVSAVPTTRTVSVNGNSQALSANVSFTVGDFSSNTSTSVDGELIQFSGTSGKTGKRATITGIAKLTAGVPSAAVAADFPTLNQSTTGTAANVSGTVAIGNGGTGQTTNSAAFNALSPVTTSGDIIYGSGTNTNARLAGNITTTKKFLVQTGDGANSAAPLWGVIAAGDVPTLNQNTTGTASNISGVLNAGSFPAQTGEVTNTQGSLATTVSNAAVIGKVLTGYTSGAGTVAATDNILQAIQKLNGNDGLRELSANKDASGGYAGLTLFKINFKNVANTFTSFFTNTNTAARTYTFQDRDGTIADNTDLALKANLASPTFTGTPTLPTGTVAVTQSAANNTTAIATTAYVDAADALKANLASPTFTGTPTLPTGTIAVTQTAANSTTAIATTAFVEGAINRKTYFDISEASASHSAAKVAGTYAMSDGDLSAVTAGTGTLYPIKIIHITGTDYPTVDGVTPKLNLKVILEVNDVAPTGNYTFGLYPVTRPATSGGAAANIYTLGTVTTGSTVLFTTPAADGQLTGTSGDFALPADGFYVVGFISTATVATSSHLHMVTYLRLRNN